MYTWRMWGIDVPMMLGLLWG
ncbi:hypothetical protein AG1IA_03037 [Rhizoctonia solani AG-1 IA]|uniref:Uncharacterized protein n=1 Tax=Thanatephorus cucumeris (strain AG1-IA) TaxID=983506 RepID=L8X1P4_THACA|nr:hypothetical protein AG1IA_03037 [Rhizoctonia solani AG-1 IA]